MHYETLTSRNIQMSDEKIVWSLHDIKIKDITPLAKNPRYIDKKTSQHLERIIDKYGLIDKPILNSDYTIIGGHQRINILKKNKEKSVLCWLPNRALTNDEIDELCIGLNLNQGAWDYDVLANEWDALSLIEWGFDPEALYGELEEKEKKTSNKKKKECPNCGHEF